MKANSSRQRIVWWLKARLAKVLCTDGMGRVLAKLLNNRVPFRGIVVDTSSTAFTPRVKAQLFWRVYESAECRFVRRYLRGTEFAIELGSSLGVVATHLAGVMADGGRLICVEANPALIPTVEAAVARMKKEKRLDVEVLHAAIVAGQEQQEASLLLGGETVGSRVVDAPPFRGQSLRVPAMALSEVVQQSAFPEYVLVSDIEGAEASFILSDDEALEACRRMVIELHDVGSGPDDFRSGELLQALIARGFRLVDRRGPVVVLDRAIGGSVS